MLNRFFATSLLLVPTLGGAQALNYTPMPVAAYISGGNGTWSAWNAAAGFGAINYVPQMKVGLYCQAAAGSQWAPCQPSTGSGGSGGTAGVTTFNGRSGTVSPAANDYSFSMISGTLPASDLPALTGDCTTTAGTAAVTCTKTNGTAFGTAATQPSTAFIASSAAPAGTIVGTTDTQTLTNKTLDGVAPATFGYLDATSSIQTQLNAKATASTVVTSVQGLGPGAITTLASTNLTDTANIPYVANANTFTGKQTFTGTATLPAFNIVGTTADPTTVNNGDMWFNTTSARLAFKAGGTSRGLVYTNDSAVNFTGGTINGVTLGATTPAYGRFTTVIQTSAETVITFSATPAFSASYLINTITLTGNVTSWTIPNGTSGQPTVTLNVCQDSTGSRTFSGSPTNVRGFGTIGSTASKCNLAIGTWIPSQAAWLFTPMQVNE